MIKEYKINIFLLNLRRKFATFILIMSLTSLPKYMINPLNIKNIIFDLGGVILNLDLARTTNKLKNMGLRDIDHLYSLYHQTELFHRLDKGTIDGKEFLEKLNALFPEPPGTEILLETWNAMLLDFPTERATLLSNLKTRYKTFLLSNTNEFHLSHFFNMLTKCFGVENMSSFVHKEYYSCRINMRKPEKEIFEFVINDNQLKPSETLFIDDSLQNVESARETGLIAYHLTAPQTILDVLKGF